MVSYKIAGFTSQNNSFFIGSRQEAIGLLSANAQISPEKNTLPKTACQTGEY